MGRSAGKINSHKTFASEAAIICLRRKTISKHSDNIRIFGGVPETLKVCSRTNYRSPRIITEIHKSMKQQIISHLTTQTHVE